MLKISKLSANRGKKKVLDNINLSINEGEIIGLVGPNGSGKSTLIKVCAGAVKKQSGTIIAAGISQNESFEKYMENIQFCYDKASFYPWLTAFENLMQIARLYDVSKEQVIEALRTVGLEKRMSEKVSKYSFGMLQRLNMAQMLLTKRKIIFLDEPLNGIDPEGVSLFRELFREMKEKYGCTLVISSHLLGELKSVCDRIVFIKSGCIVDDINMGQSNNNVHKICVSDAGEVMRRLGERYFFEKKANNILTVEIESERLGDCIADIVGLGVKVTNIESYNDVEKIYINKVGGELDE